MTDSTLELQKAVVAKLKAAAGVTTLVSTRVYDEPPQNPTYPLIQIGEDNSEPYDATLLTGWECFLVIRSWSRKPGKVEARQIMAAIKAALHDVALTLDTQTFVNGKLVSQNTVDQNDGRTTLGFQRFRFVTHE